MRTKRVKISKFTNRNGSLSWRVSGTVNGQRIRKNFSNRADALQVRELYEIQRLNQVANTRQVATTLNPEQLREAERVFHGLLKGKAQSLTFAVQHFLDTWRDPAVEKSLSEAIEDYLKAKEAEVPKIISRRQFVGIRRELHRLERELPENLLVLATSDNLKAYLDSPTQTLKTWNNRRGFLSTFFKFCLANGWIEANPVEQIPHYRIKHRRGTAETLTADETEKLMLFLEGYTGHKGTKKPRPGIMVPYFALALFAGIRPDWKDGEIRKIKPHHINQETGVIHVEPEVSKVHEKRNVQIQLNLAAWLRRYPLERYQIIPPGCREMRLEIRKKFNLGHDILRHTFVSMLVGKDRSVSEAALQAGNSEAVIRKHYLDLKSKAEAGRFWAISPTLEAGKVVAFGAGR